MKLTFIFTLACIVNTFAQLSPQALDSLQQVRYIKAKYVLHADQNISLASSKIYVLKGEKYYGEYVTKYDHRGRALEFYSTIIDNGETHRNFHFIKGEKKIKVPTNSQGRFIIYEYL